MSLIRVTPSKGLGAQQNIKTLSVHLLRIEHNIWEHLFELCEIT